jgi:hypothetical protein
MYLFSLLAVVLPLLAIASGKNANAVHDRKLDAVAGRAG